GHLSFREAVNLSNKAAAADTIVFAPGIVGTITLTGGQLVITDSVTITGPGSALLTLKGASASRHFTVSDGTTKGLTVSLSGFTLANGNLSWGDGGSISLVGESLTLTDVVFSENKTTGGGGAVAIAGAGKLTATNCSFTSNGATGLGGAVYVDPNSGIGA